MPAADATVEYVLAAAKQAPEEVNDTVLAVANLADHGADQHKECDDNRPNVSTSTARIKPATAPSVVLGWRTA